MVAAGTAAGAQVLALDIQDAETQLADATAAAPGTLTFMRCDVSDPGDWAKVAERVGQIGTPTHIHLNAGIQIAPPDAPLNEYQFEAMQLDRYRRMMGVNVDGVVFGLQALLPLCQAGTAIVVTSSLAGITPYTVDPLYAMSKHAVSGLVRSLGPTLAKREIKINAICPGGIDTAIIPHEQRANIPADSPVDTSQLMTPEHVAAEVIALDDRPRDGQDLGEAAQRQTGVHHSRPGRPPPRKEIGAAGSGRQKESPATSAGLPLLVYWTQTVQSS